MKVCCHKLWVSTRSVWLDRLSLQPTQLHHEHPLSSTIQLEKAALDQCWHYDHILLGLYSGRCPSVQGSDAICRTATHVTVRIFFRPTLRSKFPSPSLRRLNRVVARGLSDISWFKRIGPVFWLQDMSPLRRILRPHARREVASSDSHRSSHRGRSSLRASNDLSAGGVGRVSPILHHPNARCFQRVTRPSQPLNAAPSAKHSPPP